jgi:hypothetical protein
MAMGVSPLVKRKRPNTWTLNRSQPIMANPFSDTLEHQLWRQENTGARSKTIAHA